MIRTATEHDVGFIPALIKSGPGPWHEASRADALDRAIHASDGLAFEREEAGNTVGFGRAPDVGSLGYLGLLVVAKTVRGKGIGRELIFRTEGNLPGVAVWL